MSPRVRKLLFVVFCGFAIACVIGAAGGHIHKNAWVMYPLAGFFMLCAATCIPGRHTAVTGRAIGGICFAASVAYLVSELLRPHEGTLMGNEPSPLKAVLAFAVWGLPSGYVMIYGLYPKWAGVLGNKLGKDPEEERRKQEVDEDGIPRPWR